MKVVEVIKGFNDFFMIKSDPQLRAAWMLRSVLLA